MEKKMMMPANYNVMSEEEMTYTEGGALPWGLQVATSLIYTGISIYNEVWAAKNIKNFLNAHKGQDTSTTLTAGVNEFKNYINKDIQSAVIGVYSVWNQLAWWPITGLYCLLG